jgi:hypothetical protein
MLRPILLAVVVLVDQAKCEYLLQNRVRRLKPDMALSLFVIGHHEIQLVASFPLIQITNMKTQKSTHTDSIRGLVLVIPVICSMALAACSDVAGTPGTHQAVNLQSAVVGHVGTSDNVTIGPRTYNPETRSFDRPWPFGPESSTQ